MLPPDVPPSNYQEVRTRSKFKTVESPGDHPWGSFALRIESQILEFNLRCGVGNGSLPLGLPMLSAWKGCATTAHFANSAIHDLGRTILISPERLEHDSLRATPWGKSFTPESPERAAQEEYPRMSQSLVKNLIHLVYSTKNRNLWIP